MIILVMKILQTTKCCTENCLRYKPGRFMYGFISYLQTVPHLLENEFLEAPAGL